MSWLAKLFGTSAPAPEPEVVERPPALLDWHTTGAEPARANAIALISDAAPKRDLAGVAMDGSGDFAARFKGLNRGGIPDAIYSWFVSQTFLGHQLAAMVAQHWLVDKACEMPAKDAVRKGYTVNLEGVPEDRSADLHKAINKASKKYRVNDQMRQWVHKGRVFGIRILLYKVETTQANYYELPFNPDAVEPKSFKGMVQMDPYWCTPVLSDIGATDPTSPDWYNPTWWLINGKKYHRSHLAIFCTSLPADILKPVYMYGGVPLPQQIMERVYAAERTANEAPQLAMTKRLLVWTTDVAKLLLNQDKLDQHMANFMAFRDNYGIKLNDLEDEMTQLETSLTGLDELIDGQYQIVSAIARVPVTKLMGTAPKGFNATGEYDESSYHEELESIQENLSDCLLDGYFIRLLRSDIEPAAGLTPGSLSVSVDWEPLDSPTAKEQAETNKLKAETDAIDLTNGAITGEEVRHRLRTDKDSGYFGIEEHPLSDDPEAALEQITAELESAAGVAGDPLIAAAAALTDG